MPGEDAVPNTALFWDRKMAKERGTIHETQVIWCKLEVPMHLKLDNMFDNAQAIIHHAIMNCQQWSYGFLQICTHPSMWCITTVTHAVAMILDYLLHEDGDSIFFEHLCHLFWDSGCLGMSGLGVFSNCATCLVWSYCHFENIYPLW